MPPHRTPHRKIPDEEVAKMRDLRRLGRSIPAIAAALGRSRGAVSRALRRTTDAEKPRRHVDATKQRAAMLRGLEQSNASKANRPPHLRAEAFTDEWFAQCDAAFREAMRREHPEREVVLRSGRSADR